MGNDSIAKTAGDTGGNEGYATGVPVGAPPVPPNITEESLEVARDPEKLEAARADAADEQGTEPVGSEPSRLTSGYGDATNAELDAEIDARRAEGETIEVTGTGKEGAVVHADRVKALEASDSAKATA